MASGSQVLFSSNALPYHPFPADSVEMNDLFALYCNEVICSLCSLIAADSVVMR
jgi:hypothetical protein